MGELKKSPIKKVKTIVRVIKSTKKSPSRAKTVEIPIQDSSSEEEEGFYDELEVKNNKNSNK